MIEVSEEDHDNTPSLKPSSCEALILRVVTIRIIARVTIRIIARVAIRVTIRGVRIFIRVVVFPSFMAGAFLIGLKVTI